jgi:thiol-disulfide isomerase/thioredoxin
MEYNPVILPGEQNMSGGRRWGWLVVVCLIAAVGSLRWREMNARREAERRTAILAAEKTSPEGAANELAAFLKAATVAPDAESKARIQRSILKAADNLLGAIPTDEQIETAVQAKMKALDALEGPSKVAAFENELDKAGRARLARMVRAFRLKQWENRLDGVKQAKPPDPGKVRQTIAEMKVAIAEAISVFEVPPQFSDQRLGSVIGYLAEETGDNQLVTATYQSLSKIFATSRDPRLTEFVQRLEGVPRRLNLVGHKMKLEGKLLDGTPLDWSKYAGKVVLVDFWASWCPDCLAELPRLEECYRLYHSKGFDVVGLSRDYELDTLKKFVEKKKIPWAIVFGDNAPSASFTYYGIIGIPQMILVGRDGKVVAVGVEGETLRKDVENLLGN